ncbi:MAG: hypothetical protein DRP20_05455 [Thermotogae bacterium]|nr:MAG: hypothetical protein DRP20_05455 [Thermotogota bacterium]
MDNERYLKLVKWRVLNEVKQRLSEVEGFEEIYITDIMCDVVDSSVPSRNKAIGLIDYLVKYAGVREDHVDSGILDTSSLDRFVATLCYALLEQYIFNDKFINSLQRIDGDEIDRATAQKWVKKINKELEKYQIPDDMITHSMKYMDTESQIWIKKNFELSVDDFKEPYFVKEQIVDLTDAIKILTHSSKEGMTYDEFRKKINRNAIVIEHPKRDVCRIYLMEKSPNVDIRDLFRYVPASIKEAGYDLNPETYIEGKLEKKFTDKDKFIKTIARMATELVVKQVRGEI